MILVVGCSLVGTSNNLPSETPIQEPTPTLYPTVITKPTTDPTPLPIYQALPSISEIVSKVKPSVVSIAIESNIEQCDFFFGCRDIEQNGQGTGVLFDKSGLIVTNNHVVYGADKITVVLNDERKFLAELVGNDPTSDLAVIKIPQDTYDAIPFAEPDELMVGDWVIAIGNALALSGGPTVTMGIVGALDRIIDTEGGRLFNMIQTDAAINQGNSGGPLINLNGEVVGINTARNSQGEGIGFAVSAFTVIPVVSSIVENGRAIFGWIGVGVTDVTPILAAQQDLGTNRGVFVTNLTPDGPASQSGIRIGDIITAFNNIEVKNVKQLQKVVRGYEIGTKAELKVIRGERNHNLLITIEEQPR